MTGLLGVKLSPAQRVLCLVCFDGVQPRDLVGTDREIARAIVGDVDEVPRTARRTLAAMAGARSGKSFIFSLRMLHLSLVARFTLSAGEHAFSLLVAPNLKLAKIDLRYISGAVQSTKVLRDLLIAETAETVTVGRQDGKPVTIECLPATHGGTAVRGRKLVGALLDEACFFRDSNYVVNDKDVADAISARVVIDGQFIMSSTPWTESGLLFDRFTQNFGKPETALSVHAPTELMRSDDPDTIEQVRVERINDPAKAALEYDAIPLGAETTKFFDPKLIDACIDPGLPPVTMPTGFYHESHFGLDTAFRKDSTAGVVVRAMDRERSLIIVAEIREITPERGQYLKPSETLNALVQCAVDHECQAVLCDQHYVEVVREATTRFDVALREAPQNDNTEPYLAARRAMKEGRIKISAAHGRLIAQLRETVGKPTAGGKLSIVNPRKNGTHGDLVSAFVLAVWAATNEGAGMGEVVSGSSVKPYAERVTAGYGGRGRDDSDYLSKTIEERKRDERARDAGRITRRRKNVWG